MKILNFEKFFLNEKKTEIGKRIFYHGTSKEGYDSILDGGFESGYYQQQGYYGSGVYFYDNPNDVEFYDKGGVIQIKLNDTSDVLVFDDLSSFVSKELDDWWLEYNGDGDDIPSEYLENSNDLYSFAENYIDAYVEDNGLKGLYLIDEKVLTVYDTDIIEIIN